MNEGGDGRMPRDVPSVALDHPVLELHTQLPTDEFGSDLPSSALKSEDVATLTMHSDGAVIRPEGTCICAMKEVQSWECELEEKVKDLQQQKANHLTDNVAFTTSKLKARLEVERQQQKKITNHREQPVQALTAQETASQEQSLLKMRESHLQHKIELLEARKFDLEKEVEKFERQMKHLEATTRGSIVDQLETANGETEKIRKEARKVSTKKTDVVWKPNTVVVARHQFKGIERHDLPCEKGDHLTIVSATQDPNWYRVRREDGREGMVPINYLQEPVHARRAKVNLHRMDWFHGKISREDAEALMNPKQSGLYLVRESTNFPGDYCLSVCFHSEILHYRIKYKNNEYTIDDEDTFENLTQMVEHYQQDADGLATQLKIPMVNMSGKVEYSVDAEDFKRSGWHIPRRKLKVGNTFSKGEYGEVYCGEYDGKNVAIKSLKDDHRGLQHFLSEAAVMTGLSHPHLVQLIGVSLDKKPEFIVIEFMQKGSLMDYLRSRGRAVIQKQEQLGFARDVADGMAYLEHKDLIHRDLVAKNIFLSHKNMAKVSNFWLTGDATHSHAGWKLPIKWTAPEAIEDGNFSNKSDVWSYGVFLWEVFSYGRVPYPGIPVSEVMRLIQEDDRLDRPKNCPEEVYAIMKSCWEAEPRDRPMFKQLLEQLTELVQSA